MRSKHLHPIAILKILLEHSDEENILSQPTIRELLELKEGISLSRQTFYLSINLLKEFGFDIETYNDNHIGYYLRTRPFSPEEALFLCHAVESSGVLSDEEKKRVKESFLKLLSKPMSKEVLRTLTVRTVRKRKEDTLQNLRILAKAIYKEQQICFDYYHYNIHLERTINNKPFDNMEPRFLVSKDSHYYLVASGGRHNTTSHYRVDRMINIRILDDSINQNFIYQDAYQYAYNSIFMFSGTPIQFHLRCSKHIPNIYDKMIDEFEVDFRFEDVDDNWFDIYVKATPSGMIILAQKYIDCFFVISPPQVALEIKRRLSQASNWYSESS